MWIEGRRRGGASDLSKHLQKEENESVAIREIEGFAFTDCTAANLEAALKQMEATGYGKGDKRNLFHVILAPPYGVTLTPEERDFMIAYYIAHMGFQGLQYAVVEHWKKGKQHFHIAFNIIHPETGKTHELKFTKLKEWRISRGLEEIFGHAPPTPSGKAPKTWQMQRGKRSGIDPRKMRKEITAIFHANKTTKEFIKALDKAGFTLTIGQRNRLVLVDKHGDTHGLMRMIEGKQLADLRRKFQGIEKQQYPSYAELVKARKPKSAKSKGNSDETPRAPIDPQRVHDDVKMSYFLSATGAEFFARLNRHEYSLGRGLKGFAVIDSNGGRHDIDKILGEKTAKTLLNKFPDLAAIRPHPISEIIRRFRTQHRINEAAERSKRKSSGHNLDDYAGVLGDADAPRPTRRKKGDGKADGSGGGMGSMLSVFKTSPRNQMARQKSSGDHRASKAGGMERRHRNTWVAVERRSHRPKGNSSSPPSAPKL
jgi:hypothetical protein